MTRYRSRRSGLSSLGELLARPDVRVAMKLGVRVVGHQQSAKDSNRTKGLQTSGPAVGAPRSWDSRGKAAMAERTSGSLASIRSLPPSGGQRTKAARVASLRAIPALAALSAS